jgi:hypothetical protein
MIPTDGINHPLRRKAKTSITLSGITPVHPDHTRCVHRAGKKMHAIRAITNAPVADVAECFKISSSTVA